jgi:hypothetical protein
MVKRVEKVEMVEMVEMVESTSYKLALANVNLR